MYFVSLFMVKWETVLKIFVIIVWEMRLKERTPNLNVISINNCLAFHMLKLIVCGLTVGKRFTNRSLILAVVWQLNVVVQ